MKAIVDDYLEAQNKKDSAVISSIDIYDGKSKVESHITTPEAVELQQHLLQRSGLWYGIRTDGSVFPGAEISPCR